MVLSEFSPSRSEVFRSATERSEALGAEMVTFCSHKKSPAGGITPNETPSGTDRKNRLRQRTKKSQSRRLRGQKASYRMSFCRSVTNSSMTSSFPWRMLSATQVLM